MPLESGCFYVLFNMSYFSLWCLNPAAFRDWRSSKTVSPPRNHHHVASCVVEGRVGTSPNRDEMAPNNVFKRCAEGEGRDEGSVQGSYFLPKKTPTSVHNICTVNRTARTRDQNNKHNLASFQPQPCILSACRIDSRPHVYEA
ncbi:unnamed protein product, partial [Hapterophycus canaliculatus]